MRNRTPAQGFGDPRSTTELYQRGCPSRARTYDLTIIDRLLYQLSYQTSKGFVTALAHRTTLPIWGHLDLVCGGGSSTRSSSTYRTLILFPLRKTKKEDRTSIYTDRLPQVSMDTDCVYMGTTRFSGARGIRHNGLAYRSVHMLTGEPQDTHCLCMGELCTLSHC